MKNRWRSVTREYVILNDWVCAIVVGLIRDFDINLEWHSRCIFFLKKQLLRLMASIVAISCIALNLLYTHFSLVFVDDIIIDL